MLYFDDDRTADVQSQNAATAYFTYKQLLPLTLHHRISTNVILT